MKVIPHDQYKTNFVDENNMLVGFDTYQSCCEHFGWFLSSVKDDTEGSSTNLQPEDVEAYCFVDEEPTTTPDPETYDEGGKVEFRLTNGSSYAWLTLYNHHNGYYSHGFTFKKGEAILCDGGI